MGTEPQTAAFAFAGFRFFLTRKYFLCIFLYVLAFHYSRPAVRKALDLALELRRCTDGFKCLPKTAKHYLPRVIYGVGSTAALLAMSFYQADHFGALEDKWVTDKQVTLPNLGLLVIYLVLQICFMAGMVSALPNGLHWVGSQTLGSYVVHSYVNLFITVVIYDKYKVDPKSETYLSFSTSGYLASVLLVPVLIQIIIGPIVQKIVFFHLHYLWYFIEWIQSKLFAREDSVGSSGCAARAQHCEPANNRSRIDNNNGTNEFVAGNTGGLLGYSSVMA